MEICDAFRSCQKPAGALQAAFIVASRSLTWTGVCPRRAQNRDAELRLCDDAAGNPYRGRGRLERTRPVTYRV